MKSKTMQQIENMKKQTIGVEVEMYDITRDKAATIIARHFGTSWRICNTHGNIYNTHLIPDRQGRDWVIERDSSIVARYDAEKTEMSTPVLTYDDIPELQQIIRELRKAGAKSNPKHSCGVHIHIGSDDMTATQIRNLCNIMAGHESLLINAISIDSGRVSSWCQAVDKNFLKALNEQKPKTRDQLAQIWYNENPDSAWGRSQHYNGSRYHMLNLHGTFSGYYYNHTIEFRLFQFDNPGRNYKGGLHAGKLKAYIQLCLAMTQAARDLRTASPKEPQHENEKFAMRTWMIRMGMVGPEFETARKWLTDRLTGNAAWRYGRTAA